MVCENCGAKIYALEVNYFFPDGSNGFQREPVREQLDAVSIDADISFTGYDASMLDDYPRSSFVRCPKCREYPFADKTWEISDVVKITMFKGGT